MLQQTLTHHFPWTETEEVAYCGHRRADDERGSGAPTCPTCADAVDAEDRLDDEIAPEWAADGASEQHLVACVADLLEQEVLDPRIIEQLAQVYTVDTDQHALIRLVNDAKEAVANR